ncbi:phospholipase D-like domain-containing protein [Nocardioides speluncae]|uniref:phospholipase D-like domain-containing protein n=1 Tax=Nocardioides speluncae TaxID=2670337 RepID=UPI000D685901|nr:phospholipase D-like domain-containing protein [Nocardioides speluncae]
MTTRVRPVATVLTLALLSLIPAAPAGTEPSPVIDQAGPAPSFRPAWGPVFNDPLGTVAEQRRILAYLVRTIDAAPAGAVIRVAVYGFSDGPVARALHRAADRGVRIRMVLDSSRRSKPALGLQRRLGNNVRAASYVVFCNHSCRGTTGGNHTKFYLFSEAGGVADVTLVTSANTVGETVDNQWNDLFSVAGASPVYDSFARVFEQMKHDEPVPRPYVEAHQASYLQGFYPAPGAGRTAPDPWLDYLDPVRCTGAKRAGLGGHTRIRVAMSAMHGGRGLAGARRLVALRRQGCDVKVIFGAAPGGEVRRVLTAGRVPWRGTRHRWVHTHQKLLIVNGVIGRDPWATRVFTGSHNWTDPAADRDEVVLGIKGARTARLYTQNWNYVWRRG